MSERQPIYEPYGPEWVAEMMKHRKADIVGLFQAFATASRPPVDSVGVECRKAIEGALRIEGLWLPEEDCPQHEGEALCAMANAYTAALTAPADGCEGCGDYHPGKTPPACDGCSRLYRDRFKPAADTAQHTGAQSMNTDKGGE